MNRQVHNKGSSSKDIILKSFWRDNEHFAMPLRTMTYDTLGYIKEYNNIKKQHKLNNDAFPTPESFLSGITATDRFHPIITLVLYYGETLWTGPLNLSDMMVDMSDNIKSLFSDYSLNLIQILDSDKYTFYNDDVRNLFNITQNIYNENIEAIYSQYQSDDVDPEVIELISVITDTPQLLELCSNRKNGGNTMCNAFRNLEAQWAERGKQEGIAEGIKEGRLEGRLEGIASEKINSIITMLELGITKEQILTKYSLEEFNKAEETLLQNSVSQ